MARTKEPPASNPILAKRRELFNLQFPIITRFQDGREVSAWVSALREGSQPPVHIVDQLQAASWDVFTVELKGCNISPTAFVRTATNMSLSRSTISRSLDYGCQYTSSGIVVSLFVKLVGKLGPLDEIMVIQVTSKEADLFHGTMNKQPARLFINHEKGAPAQMIVNRE